MPSRHPALVLAALSLLAGAALPGPAQGQEEFQCRRGDLMRRVEVQFADDADRLPCQVLYWRDAERAGQPQVPWSAENQLEFCTEKAYEMVERLQSAGWSCEGGAVLAEDAAELDVPAATGEPSPAAGDAQDPEPTNGATQPDRAGLRAALDRDIRRLDQLSGDSSWDLDPDTATLGDLDGDGVADGAALLNFRDENGAASHHLLAYLFDGATFRPIARINVESYYKNFSEVAIRTIENGGIELLLRSPGAGRRHATFELRDGQLVLAAEIEPDA